MKKSLVAGAAAFAMAALPVAGVFAADPAPIVDTLTVQIGEACTFQRGDTGDGTYTKSLNLGQLDAAFGSSNFVVICNNATGYVVNAEFTSLAGPGEAITYSQTTPTAGSGTWTANAGAQDNMAATNAVLLENAGVTSSAGDTAAVTYKVSVRNNQGKGNYTGTATYTLTQNPAS